MRNRFNPETRVTFYERSIFSSLHFISACLLFIIYTSSFSITAQVVSQKKEIILSKEFRKDSSSFQDARPLISADGKQLFFGRRNFEKNAGGSRDLQDVWVAELSATGEYSNEKSLGKNINNLMPNGIYSISLDGNEIILTNDFNNNRIAPIAKSRKANGVWGKPVPVMIEDYYNKSPYVDFYLSYEQNVLFLAAERNNRKGDQDIFICLPDEKGNWLKPVNLGLSLNSSSADFAPYLASDGRTLFFSSFREGGLGGSDLYVSTRLDDSWTNWSKPQNLGSVINTNGNEDYLSITSDMQWIFVESVSKETQKRHLYKISVTEEIKNIDKDFFVSSK